jgi:ABC-type spermidine/putrescine transport system permease subunit II
VAAVHDPADLRGLERIPPLAPRGSSDLGGRPGTTFRRVVLPLVFPAVVAGSIFTFSLTLGDYITPDLVSDAKFIGNVIYDNSTLGNLPLAAAYSLLPIVIMSVYLLVGASPRRVRVAVKPPVTECAGTRIALRWRRLGSSRSCTLPLVILAIYAFNESRIQAWPPTASRCTGSARRRTTRAIRTRDSQLGARGDVATGIALVLGHTGCARGPALSRSSAALRFVPAGPADRLPGVVTGIALQTSFVTLRRRLRAAHDRGGHATFCWSSPTTTSSARCVGSPVTRRGICATSAPTCSRASGGSPLRAWDGAAVRGAARVRPVV